MAIDPIVIRLRQALSGYAPPTREEGGIRADAAISRFREGLTTEAGMRAELATLGWQPATIDRLVVAARLNYELDQASYQIATLVSAAGRGVITPDQLRSGLADLGMVPERIADYVLRARLTLEPTERPVAAAVVRPFYQTDEGKVRLATLRALFRDEAITEADLLAGLLDLELPRSYAEAIVDYEIARL